MTSVALVEAGRGGAILAHLGPPAIGEPTLTVPATDDLTLIAHGPELFAEDRRLLRTLATAAARAWSEQRLSEQAAHARQLAETDRIRSALLTAVSHDLRTPLAGIKASVSSLRQTDLTWTLEQQGELLRTIEESTDRLNDLISNLLAMSRIQAGALSVRTAPVAVDEVVGAALLSLGGGEELVEVPEDLPAVLADAGLLERVIANLVANARRFSPDGAPTRIQAARAGVDRVILKIIDHGPGVPRERWEEMFEPFQTLGDRDSGRGSRDGARHRPRTDRADERGDHTVADTGRWTDHVVVDSGGPMTRILIVEDEPELLRALSINLRARKYDVETAGDGTTALRLASRNPPDLVILDLGLPDMDGTEVIRGLRGWSQAPIVVLSAREGQSDKVDALDAGADDYLTKPFGMDELLARIRASLRRAQPAESEPVIRTSRFTIDLAAKRVTTQTGQVRLTPTEWHLLEILVKNTGKLVSRQQLLTEVWGPAYAKETNYLRVYMAQIRQKAGSRSLPPAPHHHRTRDGIQVRLIALPRPPQHVPERTTAPLEPAAAGQCWADPERPEAGTSARAH